MDTPALDFNAIKLDTNKLNKILQVFSELYTITHPDGSTDEDNKVSLYHKLIMEEYEEFIFEDDRADKFKELCDLIWVCIMYSIEQRYPLALGLEELVNEYKSKFYGKDGKYNPKYNAYGKLQKGEGFKKADFKKLLRLGE